MRVYRICKKQWANDLSGRGAEMYGGRWNNKRIPVVYTADSIALACVEVAVHLPLGLAPVDYELVTIEFPDKLHVLEIFEKDLPKNWASFPYYNDTQVIGDELLRQLKAPVIKVPSAAVQGTFNYLLNPRHPQLTGVKAIRVEPFRFDKRLLR